MSTQQDAPAATVSEAIHSVYLNMVGTLSLTRQTTLDNVNDLGNAVFYSINATYSSVTAWVNALSQFDKVPFDADVADKVIREFSDLVRVYADLMFELIRKHDVLTSENSPVGPDGAKIGDQIGWLYWRGVRDLQGAILRFIPDNRLNDMAYQGKLARSAYELAADRYPPPKPNPEFVDDSASYATNEDGKLNFPKAPAQK